MVQVGVIMRNHSNVTTDNSVEHFIAPDSSVDRVRPSLADSKSVAAGFAIVSVPNAMHGLMGDFISDS